MSEASTKTPWGVWAIRTGGITGYRASWVKAAVDSLEIETYATRDAAQAAAQKYTADLSPLSREGGYTPSGRPVARISYEAKQI